MAAPAVGRCGRRLGVRPVARAARLTRVHGNRGRLALRRAVTSLAIPRATCPALARRELVTGEALGRRLAFDRALVQGHADRFVALPAGRFCGRREAAGLDLVAVAAREPRAAADVSGVAGRVEHAHGRRSVRDVRCARIAAPLRDLALAQEREEDGGHHRQHDARGRELRTSPHRPAP